MSNFCERLKEARKHLKLNQGAFGALAGVSAETQLNYEKGSRKPDSSYLEAVAAHGVDVAYLLTGLRSLDPCAAPHPNPGQTLAERLQQERKRLELTVGQLADKSGVDRLALLKFEEGEFAPDAKALQQLHAVGVDVGYVLLSLRASQASEATISQGFTATELELAALLEKHRDSGVPDNLLLQATLGAAQRLLTEASKQGK